MPAADACGTGCNYFWLADSEKRTKLVYGGKHIQAPANSILLALVRCQKGRLSQSMTSKLRGLVVTILDKGFTRAKPSTTGLSTGLHLLKVEDEYSNFNPFVFRNQRTKFTIAFMWAISVNGLCQVRTKLKKQR